MRLKWNFKIAYIFMCYLLNFSYFYCNFVREVQMPQLKPLKTYWRHRKVSAVDWSLCLVDAGCRDEPVFSDGDDSTHGIQ